MGRKVKCYACLGTGDKETEMINLSTNSSPQYYHKGECEQKRLAHMAFTKQENEELDSLYILIKEIHGIDEKVILPKNFFSIYLQRLRNGEEVKMGKKIKRYKDGFTFKEIEDAYRYCAKTIKLYIKKKNGSKNPFDGLMGELAYGFAIMIDKVQLVKKRKIQAEQRKKLEEARQNMQEEALQQSPIEEREYKYTKRKDNRVDLSKLHG